MVGAEQDVLSVGVEVGCPVGPAQVGDLPLLAAVDFGHKELHGGWLNQPLGEQFQIGVGFLAFGRAARTPDQVLSVGTKKGAAIVAEFTGDLLNVAAIDVAGIQLEVTASSAGKHDFVALGANRGFGIVAFASDEQVGLAASCADGVDVIGRVNGPHIFASGSAARNFWTCSVCSMGGSVQNSGITRHKIGAGCAAKASAYWRWGIFRRRTVVHVHHVDLIAFHAPIGIGSLKDEVFAIKGPVGLGIVTAVGQLSHVVEVNLFFVPAIQAVGKVQDRGCCVIGAAGIDRICALTGQEKCADHQARHNKNGRTCESHEEKATRM